MPGFEPTTSSVGINALTTTQPRYELLSYYNIIIDPHFIDLKDLEISQRLFLSLEVTLNNL